MAWSSKRVGFSLCLGVLLFTPAHAADPDVLYRDGLSYMDGIGAEKDLERAHALLLQAAEQGHVDAQVSLGRLYYFMPGKKDLDVTREWWLKAAQQGHARAQYQLAILYLKQAGPDPLEALA